MKVKKLYTELEDLLHSVKIISDTKFSFLNKEYEFESVTSDNGMSDKSSSLETNLNNITGMRIRDVLYNAYHCRNNFGKYAMSNLSFRSKFSNTEDLTGALSEANASKGTWEPGWEIIKIERNGQIVVNKNGLSLWVFPKKILTSEGITTVGKKGYLRMVREYRRLMPGFYMANSNTTFTESNQNATIVRFYWNIETSYAPRLMSHITTLLNKECIPFRFKVLNNPNSYPRADAGVLYVHKKYIEILSKPLSTIYSLVKEGLSDSTPLLAKRLGSGLSLAENPNNDESFGQHRCRLLEEALFRIREKNLVYTDECTLEISRYFQNMGLDLDFPYLNPSSVDDYEKSLPTELFK